MIKKRKPEVGDRVRILSSGICDDFEPGSEVVVVLAEYEDKDYPIKVSDGQTMDWVREEQVEVISNHSIQLSVTKKKVLAAAAKCPTAKTTLQTLFPEAFNEEVRIELTDIGYLDRNNSSITVIGVDQANASRFWLNFNYDWRIADGQLIPTRRK